MLSSSLKASLANPVVHDRMLRIGTVASHQAADQMAARMCDD